MIINWNNSWQSDSFLATEDCFHLSFYRVKRLLTVCRLVTWWSGEVFSKNYWNWRQILIVVTELLRQNICRKNTFLSSKYCLLLLGIFTLVVLHLNAIHRYRRVCGDQGIIGPSIWSWAGALLKVIDMSLCHDATCCKTLRLLYFHCAAQCKMLRLGTVRVLDWKCWHGPSCSSFVLDNYVLDIKD